MRVSVISLLVTAALSLSLGAEPAPPVLSILTQQLAKTEDASTQVNLLRGMNAALKGRRGIAAPPEWEAVSKKLAAGPNQEVRDLVQSLGTIFGSSDAFGALRKTLADEQADPAGRKKALEALVAGKDAELPPVLKKLIEKPGPLRPEAIRALGAYSEKDTVELLVAAYSRLSVEEKRDALGTMSSRKEWAKNFEWLLDGQQIPKADVSVTLARQLRSFNDGALNGALDRHFGKLSGGSADKQAEIAKIKEWLTADFVKAGSPDRGREIYGRTCALCHKLFDAGAEIGPELTGSNRTDIDYLLQNIVDPNALIGEDYQLNTVELKDGRVLVGMVKGSDSNNLTLRTMTEQVSVPLADVKTKTVNPMSMMPEGLLGVLSKEEVRDLVRYLASSQQVPIKTP